ncbi:ABC transporter substrate-binding protein [Chengkuizengella axinellae]|uniref:ABC transporter substrate-binding protein n=1 Tax=Chengkuizengella axinellae TaxID=3064388 RepID=A0ABT9IZG0_9BACL|nr:ABC transporter substrate-binding protein [Chengkuizengella sp. 2205SS18-9]MDP5274603.1 ABC transporter substrate-binding protein [Chengkuizengella sp. 2205SS18-9]
MKLIEHYLILHTAYKNQKNNDKIETSMSEIMDILDCSRTNVRWVLNQLKEQKWISWNPGRGRGNRSSIYFYLSLIDGIKMYVSEQLAQDHFKEGMEFLQSLSIPTQIHSTLGKYLEGLFGFQTEEGNEAKHILRMPIHRDLITLDPSQISTTYEYHLVGQIYDTLLSMDSSTKQILPHLVLGWDSIDDKSWIFYLRKGIHFHHGRLFTSEDVIYTFQRLFNSYESVFYWIGQYLNSVESSGNHTVVFHFNRPLPFFPNILCSNKASIVPYDVDIKQQVVGTGPFFVQSFSNGKLSIEAFEHYFNKRAWLDRVEIFRFPEELQSSFLYEMTTEDAASIEERDKTIKQDINITQLIIFHTKKSGPQQHPSFRRAIRLALDRNIMINELNLQEVHPADSFLLSYSKKRYFPSHTLSEAQIALKESNYCGETIRMFIHPNRWRENAHWIQSRCHQIGICIELLPLDFNKTLKLLHQAHLIMVDVVFKDESEINLIEPLGNNSLYRQMFTSQENQHLDIFMDQFITGKTTAERLRTWDELIKWFHQQNLILFQFHLKKQYALSSSLQGNFGLKGMTDFYNLWIKPV